MATYCYNLVARALDNGDGSRLRVRMSDLRRQAQACLAAINAYTLIDEQFAFFKLPSTLLPGRSSTKRQLDAPSGSESKQARLDGSTMGWEVTAAPGPRDPSATPDRSLVSRQGGSDVGDAGDGTQSQERVVTLAGLRRHYALLRSPTHTYHSTRKSPLSCERGR
jgi:hypothetical protein